MSETSIQIASDHAGEAATLPRRMKDEHADSNIPDNNAHIVITDADLYQTIGAAVFGLFVHQG